MSKSFRELSWGQACSQCLSTVVRRKQPESFPETPYNFYWNDIHRIWLPVRYVLRYAALLHILFDALFYVRDMHFRQDYSFLTRSLLTTFLAALLCHFWSLCLLLCCRCLVRCRPTFDFRSFPLAHSAIRVVVIAPGNFDHPICCGLENQSLDDPRGFAALSYVWGGKSNQATIKLCGSPFHVTRNLESAKHFQSNLYIPPLQAMPTDL